MSAKIVSLEEIVSANTTIVPLRADPDDDKSDVIGHVQITALDPSFVVDLFDEATPGEEGRELTAKDNIRYMEKVLMAGITNPVLDEEGVRKLGRFKTPLFNEVMKFSGLSGEEQDESFPEVGEKPADDGGE